MKKWQRQVFKKRRVKVNMILADYDTRTMIVETEEEVQEIMNKRHPYGTTKSYKEKTVFEVTIEYPKTKKERIKSRW